MESGTFEEFNSFKKAQLQVLAEHVGFKIKLSERKQVFKNKLIDYFVKSKLFDVSILDKKVEIEEQMSEVELKLQITLKQMELEHEMKVKEMESHNAIQMKQMELKLKELENKNKGDNKTPFDVTRHMKIVPEFRESEVDQFFQHFEKTASLHSWPKEHWTLLVQHKFIGKAREIYASLRSDQSNDYEFVKQQILKGYQFVPEYYRQKFRSERKSGDEETHVEFARKQEQSFDQWLLAKDVDSSFEKLRELVLIEQFRNCTHDDIKVYLDENKVENLQDAATKADEYYMTHKSKMTNPKSNQNFKPKFQARNGKNYGEVQKGRVDTTEYRYSSTKDSKPMLKCYHCNKVGHKKADCWQLTGNKSFDKSKKGVGCTTMFIGKSDEAVGGVGPPKIEIKHADEVSDEFRPFVSNGTVSLDANSEEVPVKIVRDTGSGQSMILEGTLGLNENSATGNHVLIQGIGMEISKVPLHRVNLRSSLVSGSVQLGVRKELPIKGVEILLGNDLAGDRVHVEPIVSDQPSIEDTEDLDIDIFPSCAVTRAMSRKAAHEEQLIRSDSLMLDKNPNVVNTCGERDSQENEDHIYDLENTFLTNGVEDTISSDHEDHVDQQLNDVISREELIKQQNLDPDLVRTADRAVTMDEMHNEAVCFYRQHGVLLRKYRPPESKVDEDFDVLHQIVVPSVYRSEVLSVGHDSPMSGHLGVRKTRDRILQHFWWPSLRRDVALYCRSCHTCQVVGKPNQKVQQAPLKPIPAFDEPFSQVIIDCVGPLPRTRSGNQYILTIMCAATRFPEAIPLRNILLLLGPIIENAAF